MTATQNDNLYRPRASTRLLVVSALGFVLGQAGCLSSKDPGRPAPDGGGTGDGGVTSALESLTVSRGALVPAFEPAVLTYNVELPLADEAITVTATAVDPDATIEIAGEPVFSGEASPSMTLSLGDNTIDVVVTREGQPSQTTSIEIGRGAGVVQRAYVKASNTEPLDLFGRVAIDGDTIAVSAHAEDSAATGVGGNEADNAESGAGAVYVYARAGASWEQQAYIKASNTDPGDDFGTALAIDGDTLVVGARAEASNATGVGGDQTDNSNANSGAVYVFTRTQGVWSQQAYVKASNTGGSFGAAVSVDGDTLVVGAPGERSAAQGIDGNQADTSAASAGAVYVFVRSGATWLQQEYIKASNTDSLDLFGTSLSISADTLVVGAPGEASNGDNQADNNAPRAGASYVFTRSGTNWSQQGYLKASNVDANDAFGQSVALEDDTLAVGAPLEDSGNGADEADNGNADAGAVYVFAREAAVWTQQAYLKSREPDAGDEFGMVGISGDILVVGADGEDGGTAGIGGDESNNGKLDSGAAYIFIRDAANTWSQFRYLKASNPDPEDQFGRAGRLAISGGTIVVGALLEASAATGVGGTEDDNSNFGAGAVYVFE